MPQHRQRHRHRHRHRYQHGQTYKLTEPGLPRAPGEGWWWFTQDPHVVAVEVAYNCVCCFLCPCYRDLRVSRRTRCRRNVSVTAGWVDTLEVVGHITFVQRVEADR